MTNQTHNSWEQLFTAEEWIQAHLDSGEIDRVDELALEHVAMFHSGEVNDGYQWHSIMVDAYESVHERPYQ